MSLVTAYLHPTVILDILFQQVEYCKVEGEFYERVHALECEFAEKFKPLFEKVSLKMFVLYERKRSLYSSCIVTNKVWKSYQGAGLEDWKWDVTWGGKGCETRRMERGEVVEQGNETR